MNAKASDPSDKAIAEQKCLDGNDRNIGRSQMRASKSRFGRWRTLVLVKYARAERLLKKEGVRMHGCA